MPIVDPDQTNTVAPEVRLVHVFADGHDGGNPAPIVANATGMTSQQMQDIARDHGFESGFILPPPAATGRHRLRLFASVLDAKPRGFNVRPRNGWCCLAAWRTRPA